jgi:hypothetical protein
MPAPIIEGLDVLDEQKQLYQDLYDFNSKYAAGLAFIRAQ